MCFDGKKAQEAYSYLKGTDSTEYLFVKAAVLKAYEMVPEAYRQLFRSWRKDDKSHLEFACDLCAHFDRWCSVVAVGSYEALRELIIMELFKSSV